MPLLRRLSDIINVDASIIGWQGSLNHKTRLNENNYYRYKKRSQHDFKSLIIFETWEHYEDVKVIHYTICQVYF